MEEREIENRIIPPGINDERTRAMLGAFVHAASQFDFSKLLMRNGAEIPDNMLELAIHDYSLSEFIGEDGLPAAQARELVDNAWPLHEWQGTDKGVRMALDLIKFRPEITHWWQQVPEGAHDTHNLTVYVNDHLFADESTLLNAKAQRTALHMNNAAKRFSQATSFRLGIGVDNSIGIAAKLAARIRSRPCFKAMFALEHSIKGMAAAIIVRARKSFSFCPSLPKIEAAITGIAVVVVARARICITIEVPA